MIFTMTGEDIALCAIETLALLGGFAIAVFVAGLIYPWLAEKVGAWRG